MRLRGLRRAPDKMSFAAARAKRKIHTGQNLEQFRRRQICEVGDDSGVRKPFTQIQFCGFAARTQKTVMPDFHVTGGQHVGQEPADELLRCDRHDLLFVPIPIVPPFETDHAVFRLYDTIV